jgi:hypothetical protein
MKRISRIVIKVGFILGIAWMGTTAGSDPYAEHPSYQGEYHSGYHEGQSRHDRIYVNLLDLIQLNFRYREEHPRHDGMYQSPPLTEYENFYIEIHSEADFYEPLGEYGRWVVIEPHGRCWVPERIESDWRPYCNGQWVRTDAGWYWESDEPWSWATYHYGRWDWSPRYGWLWVPQTEWAPAWVTWRQGEGYFGWAPLPPSARFSVSGFVEFRETDISPRAFVFVEERRFLERVRPTTVIVNNTTIINKTVNITNVTVVNKTVFNEGPRTEVVEQVSGRKIQAVPFRELRQKQEYKIANKQRIFGQEMKVPASNQKGQEIYGQKNAAQFSRPNEGKQAFENKGHKKQSEQSSYVFSPIQPQPEAKQDPVIKGPAKQKNGKHGNNRQKGATQFSRPNEGNQAFENKGHKKQSGQGNRVFSPIQPKPETEQNPVVKGSEKQRAEKHGHNREKGATQFSRPNEGKQDFKNMGHKKQSGQGNRVFSPIQPKPETKQNPVVKGSAEQRAEQHGNNRETRVKGLEKDGQQEEQSRQVKAKKVHKKKGEQN